jgi:ATPase family associated with various cellular activities (AAA)
MYCIVLHRSCYRSSLDCYRPHRYCIRMKPTRSGSYTSPWRSDEHFLEILKIVNGALAGDRAKVITYTRRLAEKLEAEGLTRPAAKLRHSIDGYLGSTNSAATKLVELSSLPVDSESRLPLADQQLLGEEDTEIFLDPAAIQRIDEFLLYTASASQLLAHGVGISPTLLVYGPPGCGKTEIAKFVSARLGLPLLTARSDSLISSFLGSTAKNVRLLFEAAMRRPCVLFLDEFDALAKKRDDNNELGELKRVVISLLQNIDSMDGKTVLVAATNHPHLLDPAVWRRFSYRVEVFPPSQEIRARIFTRFLREFAPRDGTEVLALASDGMTGADIRGVSEESIRNAILERQKSVSVDAVLRRILRFRLNQNFSGLPTEENIRAVRSLDEQLFTYRRLAGVFGVSVGKINRLLR